MTTEKDRLLQSDDGSEAQPCPQGRTDYEACFAPFRYCPVKGCNRAETTEPEPAATGAEREATRLAARYPEVERFAVLMLRELDANSGKGDQAGWLAASPRALLQDITWHWAKLARTLSMLEDAPEGKPRETCGDQVREYAADVANMAMMLLDRLGLLPEASGLFTAQIEVSP